MSSAASDLDLLDEACRAAERAGAEYHAIGAPFRAIAAKRLQTTFLFDAGKALLMPDLMAGSRDAGQRLLADPFFERSDALRERCFTLAAIGDASRQLASMREHSTERIADLTHARKSYSEIREIARDNGYNQLLTKADQSIKTVDDLLAAEQPQPLTPAVASHPTEQ